MDKDNDLIDSLLKEHAKMKNGEQRDELFLEELEKRLDAEEGKAQMVAEKELIYMGNSYKEPSNKNRWGLGLGVGLGVAACAAIGFMGYRSFQNNQNEDVVISNEKASDQFKAQRSEYIQAPNARDVAQDSNLLSDRTEIEAKPALASDSVRKDARAIAAEVPAQPSKAKMDMKMEKRKSILEPSLDFGDGDDFEKGYRSSKDKENVAGNDKSGSDILRKPGARTKNKKRMMPETDLIPNDIKIRGPHQPRPSSSERYGDLVENKWISPSDKDTKLSTFAVDVDTASYANLRRMISSNNKVPANAIRIEEMVNYFDYNYSQPAGEHPFAVHVDSAACPWNDKNKLVRIAIKGKDLMRDKRPASNIVFLLDVSGSMNDANKLPLLKESLQYLLEELNEKDTVSIVVYAGASGLALPPTHVDDDGRRTIIASLDKLNAGGSTAGGQGIKLAYKLAKENFVKKGVNRVILATDGDFNVGVSSTKGLTDLIKQEAKGGSYLSVLGFGNGNINDEMLETITNNGNGNYSYIDSIKEGRKVLLEDMMGTLVTIAKDVKVRVEFNPEKVKEYRLIGYANRVLPNSAFLDKTADAGEIGAGHTVTAFYEIIPGKATNKAKLDNLRFGKQEIAPETEVPAEHADKLLFVDLAYKQPDQKVNDESTYLTVSLIDANKTWADTDSDFKFASSVALFGMILRDSDYSGNGDINLVEKLAAEGKGNDGKGHREEFLQLVKKAKARK